MINNIYVMGQMFSDVLHGNLLLLKPELLENNLFKVPYWDIFES